MSFSIQKLVRSKIQKFLNISLVNDSLRQQIKESKKESAVITVLDIFKKEIDSADEKINKIKKSLDKDKDKFFKELSVSTNYLLDNGIWDVDFNDREKSLDNKQQNLMSSIPEELKDNIKLKEHIKNKIQLQKNLNVTLQIMKEISEESKTLIEKNISLKVIDNNLIDYKQKKDKIFDMSISVIDNFEFAAMDSDEIKVIQEDIEKTKSELNLEEYKENIASLKEAIKKLKQEKENFGSDNSIIFNSLDSDPEEFDQLIESYENEIIIIKNIIEYLEKKISALEQRKKIIENDKEISEFIDKEYKSVFASKSKEEIRRVLGEIDNEEFIDRLAEEFKKYDTSFNGITEYLLTEIMQSMTTDAFDTIDIYKKLTSKEVISQLHIDEKNCKLKILTNLVGEGSVNSKLGILKEKMSDNGNYFQRFGIINNNESIKNQEFFSLNELIYGPDSSDEKTLPLGVNLKKNIYSKKNPLMSYTMILDPNLKASKRNELELSVFLNAMSTIELSKSTPYFNAMFILPDAVLKGGKVYKTASITQFLNGTSVNEKNDSLISKGLHSKYNKQRANTGKIYSGTKSNMSLFTAPQTLNNFDEVFVGRQSSKEEALNKKIHKYTRANNVHDVTRPFMTIKSFTIDVAPTQGLLSMKTGKISLVVHDKTRMTDIAPFIKPDMFGAYGAELLLEYGWNNIDGQDPNVTNHVGEFIDSLKVREKYIITNSSFNITKNGEVNIDLSIAMRGPIDLKNTFLTTNSDVTINMSRLKVLYDSIKAIKDYLTTPDDTNSFIIFSENVIDNIFNQTVSGKTEKEFMNESVAGGFNRIYNYVSSINLQESSSNFRNSCIANINKSSNKLESFKNIFKQNFMNPNYALIDTDVNFFITQNPGILPKDFIEKSANLLTNYYTFFKTLKDSIKNAKKLKNIQKEFVENKVMKPIGTIDPFFDKDWSRDYKRLINKKDRSGAGSQFTTISDAITTSDSGKDLTYITLGTLITSIVGTHLKESARYDDIQIISYNLNKSAGLMSGRNISSLLVSRKDIKELASDIFTSRSKITLEGFLSKIIQDLIHTNKQICFGLKDLYLDKEKGKESKEEIDQRLSSINKIVSATEQKFVEFQLPRIKMFFDTFVKKDAAEKSILRITLYDENDNPYKELSTLFTEENELLQLTTALNRQKVIEGEKSSIYKEKSVELFKKLISKKYVVPKKDADGNITYTIDATGKMMSKHEIKKRVPSITYGSQNSGIIEANVTTINEGNLGTVLMTRNDRKTGKVGDIKVTTDAELPLQILPSKASVTMFGCPIVNFSQYMFLDFETGTTIDNFYAVTGINHNLSPGNFTTNLTLSYGDAYGKYFSALSTVENLLQRTLSGKNKYTLAISKFETNSSLPDSVENLEGKNFINISENKFEDQDVKKKITSSRPYETKLLSDKIKLTYTQNINFMSEGDDIKVEGQHLGSVVNVSVESKKDQNEKITSISIVLTHDIFRSENFESRNLVPNYKVSFKDILNLVFKDKKALEDKIKK